MLHIVWIKLNILHFWFCIIEQVRICKNMKLGIFKKRHREIFHYFENKQQEMQKSSFETGLVWDYMTLAPIVCVNPAEVLVVKHFLWHLVTQTWREQLVEKRQMLQKTSEMVLMWQLDNISWPMSILTSGQMFPADIQACCSYGCTDVCEIWTSTSIKHCWVEKMTLYALK